MSKESLINQISNEVANLNSVDCTCAETNTNISYSTSTDINYYPNTEVVHTTTSSVMYAYGGTPYNTTISASDPRVDELVKDAEIFKNEIKVLKTEIKSLKNIITLLNQYIEMENKNG